MALGTDLTDVPDSVSKRDPDLHVNRFSKSATASTTTDQVVKDITAPAVNKFSKKTKAVTSDTTTTVPAIPATEERKPNGNIFAKSSIKKTITTLSQSPKVNVSTTYPTSPPSFSRSTPTLMVTATMHITDHAKAHMWECTGAT